MSDELTVERFKNVTTMIRYHNDKMVEAFARFVRFSVGIVAGSVYLFFVEKTNQELKDILVFAVPILFWFVAISSLAVIFSNWRSWRGFREAEAQILKDDLLRPKKWRSAREQLIMTAIMIAVCLFVTYFYLCELPEKLPQ